MDFFNNDITARLPSAVAALLARIRDYGYSAYLAGECVRDLTLGIIPADYDVLTNAEIRRLYTILEDYTFINSSESVSDENSPEKKSAEDLRGEHCMVSAKGCSVCLEYCEDPAVSMSRRDFTVNAACLRADRGIVDIYGGLSQIKPANDGDAAEFVITLTSVAEAEAELQFKKKLQAAELKGEKTDKLEPEKPRLPLRHALSALEYISAGGPGNMGSGGANVTYIMSNGLSELVKRTLAEQTAENLSPAESFPSEDFLPQKLKGLLLGKFASRVILTYADGICGLIPELKSLREFSPAMFEHCVTAVGLTPPVLSLRLALLFCCIGKPDCLSSKNGLRRYKGYRERSRLLLERILRRLTPIAKLNAVLDVFDEASWLLEYSDCIFPAGDDKTAVKLLAASLPGCDANRLGLLLRFKYARTSADPSLKENFKENLQEPKSSAATIYKNMLKLV